MIYFVWQNNADPHDAGLPTPWQALTEPYNGLIFGVFPNAAAADREAIGKISPDLVCLPGVNGKLNADQAVAISPAFASAKAGDLMYDVLATVYAATNMPFLDPDT
jgi:hypothetical protein